MVCAEQVRQLMQKLSAPEPLMRRQLHLEAQVQADVLAG